MAISIGKMPKPSKSSQKTGKPGPTADPGKKKSPTSEPKHVSKEDADVSDADPRRSSRLAEKQGGDRIRHSPSRGSAATAGSRNLQDVPDVPEPDDGGVFPALQVKSDSNASRSAAMSRKGCEELIDVKQAPILARIFKNEDSIGEVRDLVQKIADNQVRTSEHGEAIAELRHIVNQIGSDLYILRGGIERRSGIADSDPAKKEAVTVEESLRHRTAPKPSDSSSSDSDDSGMSSSSSSDDGSRRSHRKKKSKSKKEKKGPKHPGLKELRVTDLKFLRVLSYRTYRLRNTSHRRKSKETGKVKDQIRRMEITLRKQMFSGTDGILVLNFLACFVREANILEMSEAQAYLALPQFLQGFALSQFEAVRDSSAGGDGGVRCWPEAVQYLLRSYATSNEIQRAMMDLRNVTQNPGEDERDYSTRLEDACRRVGNVHSLHEKCTMFESGLVPEIRALVSRHREANPNISFLELVQFARAEGETHRARSKMATRSRPPSSLRRTSVAAMVDDPQEASISESMGNVTSFDQPAPRYFDEDGNEAFFGNEVSSSVMQSVPIMSQTETLSTPRTSEFATASDHGEAMLASGRKWAPTRWVPSRQIPHADKMTQRNNPGWGNTPQSSRQERRQQLSRLICFICYKADDHISPNCTHPMRDVANVVANYEALSSEEQDAVPIASYRRAKSQLAPSKPGARGASSFEEKN